MNTADACVETGSVVGNVVWCILDNTYRVSVQPGDIVGVELPSTTSDEIYFTHGGPTNYIFQRQLDSTNDLSLNESVVCLLYTSPSPRDATLSRMPSSA